VCSRVPLSNIPSIRHLSLNGVTLEIAGSQTHHIQRDCYYTLVSSTIFADCVVMGEVHLPEGRLREIALVQQNAKGVASGSGNRGKYFLLQKLYVSACYTINGILNYLPAQRCHFSSRLPRLIVCDFVANRRTYI